MSYNGSGTFQINTSGQPVVTGTSISSTVFNALTADLATGLSTAITKDGQTTTTARIPFALGINSTLVTDATNTTSGSIITAGGVGIAKALYVGTTANVAGLTASSAVATDASKNLVSVTNTGTGNNVLATGPTISGPTISDGTANGVAYLNGSKVLTTGSALVFDGTNFSTTGTIKGATTIGVGNATPSTSGAGITFPATQSASTDANTLDDYEEGTWTPRLADVSSGGNSNLSGSAGWYTKIGNQVTIYGKFDPMTTTGFTALNQLWVRDLPFPSANTIAITPGYTNVDNITYAGDHPIPYLQTSASGFRLRSNTSGSAGTLILVSSVTSGSAWIYFVVTYQV